MKKITEQDVSSIDIVDDNFPLVCRFGCLERGDGLLEIKKLSLISLVGF